jgi:hypothetical protein
MISIQIKSSGGRLKESQSSGKVSVKQGRGSISLSYSEGENAVVVFPNYDFSKASNSMYIATF